MVDIKMDGMAGKMSVIREVRSLASKNGGATGDAEGSSMSKMEEDKEAAVGSMVIRERRHGMAAVGCMDGPPLAAVMGKADSWRDP